MEQIITTSVLPHIFELQVDTHKTHVSLVVSPLLTLMADQQLRLQKFGIKSTIISHEHEPVFSGRAI